MARRPPKSDPELQAHKEWLGYLQPRGLVVAPAAMWEAGWVLEQSGRELLERQEQFREALQPLGQDEDDEDDQPRGFRRLEALLVEQLSWDAEALQRDPATLQTWTRELPELMVGNNEGRTSTYNRFHDPAEFSDGILELRRLHDEMDPVVLATYGLSDALPTGSASTPSTSPYGFRLDYLDTEDDALLPPDLQERIASGDLFFPTASEACSFQAQLRRYGAIKASLRLALMAPSLARCHPRRRAGQASGPQRRALCGGAGDGVA